MSDRRIGLVLGAGGIMGGAWLTGALDALAEETGWDPGSADHLVGTSAGSVMASLLAGGVPPWFMVAHSAGRTFEGVSGLDGRPAAEADRAGGGQFMLARALPPIGPGSLQLALRTLSRPREFSPTAMAIGWLPRGFLSNEPIRDILRRVTPDGWSPHPNLWVVAADYATGDRVVFGREDAPKAELPDAVAASCAIPGLYHPVAIGGRRYVDNGPLGSNSNLDVLAGLGLDLVICLNPTSSLHGTGSWNPVERVADFNRMASGRRLGTEARVLRDEGTEVVLVQPLVEDLLAMGPNLMSTRGRNKVIATARETVAHQLRSERVHALLSGLPAGAPYMVCEPQTAPEQWGELRDEALAVRFG